MDENKKSKPHENHLGRSFYKKLIRNIIIGFLILLVSLGGGMAGYHYLESLSWIDSYLNAAMILSGMGPVATLQTNVGKIFAGTYALFSGVVFLISMAIVLAPVFRKFMHQFHLDEERFR